MFSSCFFRVLRKSRGRSAVPITVWQELQPHKFFDWDDEDGLNGQPDHVGIVEKVENGYIYTIEGNSGDRVVENAWCIGYYEILGYGVPLYNN